MAKETVEDRNHIHRPSVGAVDRSVERTHVLLVEFKDEIARLIHRIHEDVDRLREMTLGEPGRSPRIEPDRPGQAEADRDLAGLVDQEQWELRMLARVERLIDKKIDKRFNQLNELIQARLLNDPLQTLSRRPR